MYGTNNTHSICIDTDRAGWKKSTFARRWECLHADVDCERRDVNSPGREAAEENRSVRDKPVFILTQRHRHERQKGPSRALPRRRVCRLRPRRCHRNDDHWKRSVLERRSPPEHFRVESSFLYWEAEDLRRSFRPFYRTIVD
ncbi:hypothetical protein EVAR_29920_1 [Eumeta japonica]|uniref:Uncharacterized protein n=1 Tax=Eumeta variegata TaxID=151549 RepID=A0A4C1V6T7_EUMVA|nr:hypothetical protein EVAR_29920_1 [Eumeta japonica]